MGRSDLASSARSVPLSVGITGASYGSATQDLGVLDARHSSGSAGPRASARLASVEAAEA